MCKVFDPLNIFLHSQRLTSAGTFQEANGRPPKKEKETHLELAVFQMWAVPLPSYFSILLAYTPEV